MLEDADRARQHLARRTIVFVGDSNTRYQYLSFITLLRTGAFPVEPSEPTFSVCNEGSAFVPAWKRYPRVSRSVEDAFKWKHFFQHSREAAGGDNEVCECDRAKRVENRWFVRGDTRVIYLQLRGPAHASLLPTGVWPGGFDSIRDLARDACRDLVSGCNVTSDTLPASYAKRNWRDDTVVGGFDAFLHLRLRPLLRRGDALVLGIGPWWTPRPAQTDELRTFMRGVRRLIGPEGHAVFKSCPRGSVFTTDGLQRETRGCGNSRGCESIWRSLLAETRWSLLDLFSATDDLYRLGASHFRRNVTGFQTLTLTADREPRAPPGKLAELLRATPFVRPFNDNFHFRCEVYAEANRMLLDLLSSSSAS